MRKRSALAEERLPEAAKRGRGARSGRRDRGGAVRAGTHASPGGACIHLPPSAPFRVNAAGDALHSQTCGPPSTLPSGRNTVLTEAHL
ncbi:unnamed protein product [Rangifer tarandus platyrhynchus]|uniref:Uncharacterized protein n=1 Tax=Rangifer tarandus platyrhynchus TaxID=3082113 RepID=A0ABN8Y786_RANTA|nr:unnamed protein product [Rangifer tarandus platyrhynchus]